MAPISIGGIQQRYQHDDSQDRPYKNLSSSRDGRHDEARNDEVRGGQNQDDDQKADEPAEVHRSPITVARSQLLTPRVGRRSGDIRRGLR